MDSWKELVIRFSILYILILFLKKKQNLNTKHYIFMKKLLSMMLMLMMIVACSKEEPKEIILEKGTSTEQTVYADETSTGKGISFVASEPWKAEVNEISTTRTAGRVDWIELSQYEGGAGDYTLTLTLNENHTQADRKAEITIVCGSTIIKIMIEQKATKENGEEMKPDIPQKTKMISEIISYSKNEKNEYEVLTKITFDYDEKGKLIHEHHDFPKGEYKDDFKSWDYQISYSKDSEGNDIVKSDCKNVTFDGNSWTYTETLTLDASGKAVKWKDEAVNANKSTTCLFYYNDKNQHIRTDVKGIPGDSYSNFSINATWGAGDLMIGGEIPNFSCTAKIDYNESILNDANLDLAFTNITYSSIYRMRSEGYIFQSLDFWGTRIKKMPSKIVDKQKGNQDETYNFEYQLDKDNRIISCTIKYVVEGVKEEDKFDIKYIQ